MKIFFAGATGRRLLPRLIQEGHEVTALTRSQDRAEALRVQGAQPVVGDVFGREALVGTMTAAQPEVVIHQRLKQALILVLCFYCASSRLSCR